MIAEGLHLSSEMQIWPSIATPYTDMHMYSAGQKHRKQQGARFMTEYNQEAMKQRLPFRTSQEVDPLLLLRTAEYRATTMEFECGEDGRPELEHGFDNHLIIPKERALNDPALEGSAMPEQDMAAQTKITHGIFRMFLFMDIVKGVDSSGEPKSMKVSMILLQASTPGTDPLVAVKQIGEQNSRMSSVLLNTLSHMKMVLLNDYATGMSMCEAFSTGTQREAARLCSEALLPFAVFKFAHDYGLFNVHFGGMRMDVNNEEEMKAWGEYQVRSTQRIECACCGRVDCR